MKSTVRVPFYILASFTIINWPYRHVLISRFSILFHLLLCLFLCHFHALFITLAMWYSLISSTELLSNLFFFFKISVVIQSLWWFHVNFLKYFILVLILERGEGREREGEEHQCERETMIGCLRHAPGHQVCNPGMCPDQESNRQPYGLWDGRCPTNWATPAGAPCTF